MVLLCVMRLIKNEERNFLHRDERMRHALVKNCWGANDDLILILDSVPRGLIPQILFRRAMKHDDFLVDVALQDTGLLLYKMDAVLSDKTTEEYLTRLPIGKEEDQLTWLIFASTLLLLI